jgi:hypothetical protein
MLILLLLTGTLGVVVELLLIGMMYERFAQQTGFTVLIWLNFLAQSLVDVLMLLIFLEIDEELEKLRRR